MIHPTAQVDPRAVLGEGVEVGAFSVIGAEVEIGHRTRIGPHVVLEGPTRIGEANHIHPFSSLGGPPQDKKYGGERTSLTIGDRNVIREYCTFNRGTEQGGGVTVIGDDNWIMAYVHVAHDCLIASDIIMANGTTLAGHVRVDSRVTLGAFTTVHQFCSIGRHAFTAMGTIVLKDVPPYVTAAGNSASPHGINSEGLRRAGFPDATLRALREAYKTLYKRGNTLVQACDRLRTQSEECEEVQALIDFVQSSRRGIIR